MLGRWTPVLPTTSSKWTTPPHVVFLQDGTWTGSDGCNEEGGRWDLEPDGSFHAEGDPSRQLGCDNVQTAVWLRQAQIAEVNGDLLILKDAKQSQLDD